MQEFSFDEDLIRRLVPVFADQGDEGFVRVRGVVLGRARKDCPREAGLDALLRDHLDGQRGARSRVRLTELFERLVRYRNRELGHGAAGQQPSDVYSRLGRAMLAGVAEMLNKFDALAGHQLLYIADVRQARGTWLVERYELVGEQRELLTRILDMEVGSDLIDQWATRSQAEEPADEVPAEIAPRTLGDFELISRIGRGGMGVVYRAWQPSLGRQVALKCLIRSGDAKAEARFAREIRALGRVDHPNLVKTFTSGSEGEQWFYAMELIEGTDLARVCDFLSDGSASDVSEKVWQAALSTACDNFRTKLGPWR